MCHNLILSLFILMFTLSPVERREPRRSAPETQWQYHVYLCVLFGSLVQQHGPGSHWTFSTSDLEWAISPWSSGSLSGEQYIKHQELSVSVCSLLRGWCYFEVQQWTEPDNSFFKRNREFKLIAAPQVSHYGAFLLLLLLITCIFFLLQ